MIPWWMAGFKKHKDANNWCGGISTLFSLIEVDLILSDRGIYHTIELDFRVIIFEFGFKLNLYSKVPL